MSNHLQFETSPYLLQHAQNPVDWYPWGPEALEKARSEEKPIFLSIGYAACHWCHVMAHESFEDEHTAAVLNQYYVSIKVDREERPDLDMLYMLAVQRLTGSGGWPLSIFLTPDLKPFYGGTYFPPSPRHGLPAFADLLLTLAEAWRTDRQKIDDISDQVGGEIATEATWAAQSQKGALSFESLSAAADDLLSGYDWENGGWGGAPKFPAPMAIDFLLTQASRGHPEALKAARHALDAMTRGGLFDVVGGGFHRYSTDETWLVSHFEKMLYDNAQLALAYLHAYQLTGKARYARVTSRTLDFILRELTNPQGGFICSLDADSEGQEGKFYLWTVEELRQALNAEDFRALEKVYNLDPGGNFEGKLILQRKLKPGSEQSGETEDSDLERQLDGIHKTLLERREQRIRPAADSKVLAAWNGLALRAFAEAGVALGRPDYVAAAQRNAKFITENMIRNGSLVRSWRVITSRPFATLEDYASLVIGLVALYQADFDLAWFRQAEMLTAEMIRQFKDPAGGFYLTLRDQADLVTRPKDLQDNATPSANALAIQALLLMAAFTGNSEWNSLAEEPLKQLEAILVRYPAAFPYWLTALDFAIGPVNQVALAAPDGANTAAVTGLLARRYHPRAILAVSGSTLPEGSPAILQGRPPISGKLTAYFCHGFVCDLPLTEPEKIKAAIDSLK